MPARSVPPRPPYPWGDHQPADQLEHLVEQANACIRDAHDAARDHPLSAIPPRHTRASPPSAPCCPRLTPKPSSIASRMPFSSFTQPSTSPASPSRGIGIPSGKPRTNPTGTPLSPADCRKPTTPIQHPRPTRSPCLSRCTAQAPPQRSAVSLGRHFTRPPPQPAHLARRGSHPPRQGTRLLRHTEAHQRRRPVLPAHQPASQPPVDYNSGPDAQRGTCPQRPGTPRRHRTHRQRRPRSRQRLGRHPRQSLGVPGCHPRRRPPDRPESPARRRQYPSHDLPRSVRNARLQPAAIRGYPAPRRMNPCPMASLQTPVTRVNPHLSVPRHTTHHSHSRPPLRYVHAIVPNHPQCNQCPPPCSLH